MDIDLYQRKPKDYSRVSQVKSIKKNYDILSYAYGGVESGENRDEFVMVVEKAQQSGYNCIMLSLGPAMDVNDSFNEEHTHNVREAIEFVKSKNIKLMIRTYINLPNRNYCDVWSDGRKNHAYQDLFVKEQFDAMIKYNIKFVQSFDCEAILSYSPTFYFLGQSLYDADNFSNNPFGRITGYSDNAKNFFNCLYNFNGDLPLPTVNAGPQEMKTVLWYKTRQNQLTRYAEAVVDSMKKVTEKPVGIFAELYSGDFTHLSEAAPQNQDFWLEDCTFGSQTYDMERSFCETHGNMENTTSYTEYYGRIGSRIEDAASKGAKLVAFYYRINNMTGFDDKSYCFNIIKDIKKLEEKYDFEKIVAPKVGVYFGANYAYTIFTNEKNFLLESIYRYSTYPITKRIEAAWRNKGVNWEMFGDVDIPSIDFSKYKVVFLTNFAFFEKDSWENIDKYPNTVFVFTGDFAMGYNDKASGYSEVTGWERSKVFDGLEITYTRIENSWIKVENRISLLGKNLGDYIEGSRIALVNMANSSDIEVIAVIDDKPFIFTRKNGKHIFITTNLFGKSGLTGSSELTDNLVDNILNYSGL